MTTRDARANVLAARQTFLARPHVAALSVSLDGSGPLTMPIWYGYEPGGDVWIITSPTSAKMRAIRRTGRVSLLVDVTSPTLRYVAVECAVVSIAEATERQVADLAGRYLTGPALDRYLAQARAQHGEQVIVRMEPERWSGSEIAMPTGEE